MSRTHLAASDRLPTIVRSNTNDTPPYTTHPTFPSSARRDVCSFRTYRSPACSRQPHSPRDAARVGEVSRGGSHTCSLEPFRSRSFPPTLSASFPPTHVQQQHRYYPDEEPCRNNRNNPSVPPPPLLQPTFERASGRSAVSQLTSLATLCQFEDSLLASVSSPKPFLPPPLPSTQ